MKTAIIKRVAKGKQRGQLTFVLKAENHETIAIGEAYKNKQDLVDTVTKHFPDFKIDDKSHEGNGYVIVD